MTRHRILELRDTLKVRGWEFLNEAGEACDSQELLSIEDEIITWKIAHTITKRRLELRFLVRGHLGQVSNDLHDLQHCMVTGDEIWLIFPGKRNRKGWKSDLREFLDALDVRAFHDK